MSDTSGFLHAVCFTNGGWRCGESVQERALLHGSGQQGTPGTSCLTGPSRGSLTHVYAESTAESEPGLLGVNGFTQTHTSAPSALALPGKVLHG